MPTFTAEDGTGLDDANSLITVAYADGYFADRYITTWTGSDAQKQAALIKATDYIETRYPELSFNGTRLVETQALSFPRSYLYSKLGVLIEGVPEGIKKAVSEYALRALSADLISDPGTEVPNTKRRKQKVGPIEEDIEFFVAPSTIKSYPAADMLLRPFLRGAGGAYR